MARSLSIVALLVSCVVAVAAAADNNETKEFSITVGCRSEKGVCACNESLVTKYVADGGCHTYSRDSSSSYKVGADGLEIYGTADCTKAYTVVTSSDAATCGGNYTTAVVQAVAEDKTSFNATMCYPAAAKVECGSIAAGMTTNPPTCLPIPNLKPTEDCRLLVPGYAQVAYTASIADDSSVSLTLYLNMAECLGSHMPAFIGRGMAASPDLSKCQQHQQLYKAAEVAAVTTSDSDNGAAAGGLAAVAIVAGALAYLMM